MMNAENPRTVEWIPPRWSLDKAKMTPGWSHNEIITKIKPRSSQDQAKIKPRSNQVQAKMKPRSSQDQAKIQSQDPVKIEPRSSQVQANNKLKPN